MEISLRVLSFALSLLIIEGSGKTLFVTLFSFYDELDGVEFLRVLMWMSMYLIISFVSLFLSFNPVFVGKYKLILLSVVGVIASLDHYHSINCSGPMSELPVFDFLGCVGGYGLHWIVLVESVLMFLIAITADYKSKNYFGS